MKITLTSGIKYVEDTPNIHMSVVRIGKKRKELLDVMDDPNKLPTQYLSNTLEFNPNDRKSVDNTHKTSKNICFYILLMR